MSVQTVRKISKFFDADGSGTIEYQEFVEFCEARDAEEAIAITKAVKFKAITKGKFTEEELLVRRLRLFLFYCHTEHLALERFTSNAPFAPPLPGHCG